MADNAVLTNQKNTFDGNTNPDIPVRSLEKSGKQTQAVVIDWGGAGAENFTTPSFGGGIALKTYSLTRPSFTSGASGTAIAANTSRKELKIINHTNFSFYLNFGAAAVSNQGYLLNPGQVETLYTGQAVNAIQSSGSTLELDVYEGV